MQQILIKPLITEKMTTDTEKNNAYGFVVHDGANKVEIKKEETSKDKCSESRVDTARICCFFEV